MKSPFIGTVRHALLIPGKWRWNAWVRDFTAWLELRGFLGSEAPDGYKYGAKEVREE